MSNHLSLNIRINQPAPVSSAMILINVTRLGSVRDLTGSTHASHVSDRPTAALIRRDLNTR
jgi:hypothetical protein